MSIPTKNQIKCFLSPQQHNETLRHFYIKHSNIYSTKKGENCLMKFEWRKKTRNGDILCSIVTWDKKTNKVYVENYTDDLLDRAFGVRTDLTKKDLDEFMERRSIPRNRNDMKTTLKCLGVRKYDPYKIAKKFNGETNNDLFHMVFLED